MREVLDELVAEWRQGRSAAVGTVVSTYRSAPRPAGAAMLVTADERVVGSVSGGCVEGAVFELGQQVLADDTPVLQRYGVSDDVAFEVLVETLSAELSLRDPEDIELYARRFELFWDVSRRGDDAIALITELVQQLRSIKDNHGRMPS